MYVAFDLLFLNGVSLLRRPLVERRRLLRSHFTEVRSRVRLAERIAAGHPLSLQVHRTARRFIPPDLPVYFNFTPAQVPGKFSFATAAESNDVEEMNDFLNEAVKGERRRGVGGGQSRADLRVRPSLSRVR